jgi:hypothetical protein
VDIIGDNAVEVDEGVRSKGVGDKVWARRLMEMEGVVFESSSTE